MLNSWIGLHTIYFMIHWKWIEQGKMGQRSFQAMFFPTPEFTWWSTLRFIYTQHFISALSMLCWSNHCSHQHHHNIKHWWWHKKIIQPTHLQYAELLKLTGSQPWDLFIHNTLSVPCPCNVDLIATNAIITPRITNSFAVCWTYGLSR